MTSDTTRESTFESADDQQAINVTRSPQEHGASAADRVNAMVDEASVVKDNLNQQAQAQADRFRGSARQGAKDRLRTGQAAAEHGSGELVGQVRKQPMEALLLAAALGYLVGWAL